MLIDIFFACLILGIKIIIGELVTVASICYVCCYTCYFGEVVEHIDIDIEVAGDVE